MTGQATWCRQFSNLHLPERHLQLQALPLLLPIPIPEIVTIMDMDILTPRAEDAKVIRHFNGAPEHTLNIHRVAFIFVL